MAGCSPEGEDFAREDAADQEEGVRGRLGGGVAACAAAASPPARRARSWQIKEKQKSFPNPVLRAAGFF